MIDLDKFKNITKGKWNCFVPSEKYPGDQDNFPIIVSETGERVCGSEGFFRCDGTDIDNATACAAVPEMIAEIERLYSFLFSLQGHNPETIVKLIKEELKSLKAQEI